MESEKCFDNDTIAAANDDDDDATDDDDEARDREW